jgi:hypothetical protein
LDSLLPEVLNTRLSAVKTLSDKILKILVAEMIWVLETLSGRSVTTISSNLFNIWHLESAWKHLPRRLDIDAVEDVSVLVGSVAAWSTGKALLDDSIGFPN